MLSERCSYLWCLNEIAIATMVQTTLIQDAQLSLALFGYASAVSLIKSCCKV